MRPFSLRHRPLLARAGACAAVGASLLGGFLAQAPAVNADFAWCWEDPGIHVSTLP